MIDKHLIYKYTSVIQVFVLFTFFSCFHTFFLFCQKTIMFQDSKKIDCKTGPEKGYSRWLKRWRIPSTNKIVLLTLHHSLYPAFIRVLSLFCVSITTLHKLSRRKAVGCVYNLFLALAQGPGSNAFWSAS